MDRHHHGDERTVAHIQRQATGALRAGAKLGAAVWLLLARATLGVLPFRWLSRWFTAPVRGPELAGRDRGADCHGLAA